MKKLEQQPEYVKGFVFFALFELIITGILLLAVRWIFPEARDETRNIIVGAIQMVIAILWIYRETHVNRFRRPAIILIAIVVGVVITVLLWVTVEQRTMYFVVDASSNMSGHIGEIKRVELETISAVGKNAFGLMVFGGGLSGKVGCNDIKYLVEPSPDERSLEDISTALRALTDLQPTGFGGLQNAVMAAIELLKDRKGLHQIFVITSGYDDRCEDLDRADVDELAGRLGVRYELIVVTIGALSEAERVIFDGYADRHMNTVDALDVKQAIQDVVRSAPLPYGPYSHSQ